MRIIAVDDEKLQLNALVKAIKEASPLSEVVEFSKAMDALDYAENNEIDVAFLDIQMPGIKGIELAKRMKEKCRMLNVIFCTAYDHYALEALKIHASGYLTKPVSAEKIRVELENLRYPIQSEKKVTIRCFGNFEILVNGEVVRFGRDKSKEVVAFLVDRQGAICTNAEIIAAVWEDDEEHGSYLQKIRQDIRSTLIQYGSPELVVFGWGKMGIRREVVQCDYYDWIDGKPEGINAYHGEYMVNYSWAEYNNANFFRASELEE